MSSARSPSVGVMLRDSRERAALSVEDIAERTRIRATLIRAIETDDFSTCGGNFYARGHVRSIATTLGLDPAPFVSRFNSQVDLTGPIDMPILPELPPYEPVRPPIRPSRPPMAARSGPTAQGPMPSLTPGRASASRLRSQRSGPSWTSAMLVAATVVAILAVGSFAFNSFKRPIQQVDARRPQIHATTPPPVVPTPTHPASPAPVAPTGVNLRLQVTNGSSWVRVLDGSGASIFEGVLAGGAVKEFSDPKSLTVKYGNSSAVTVVFNGHDQGSPSKSCGGTVCTQHYQAGPAGG